ncbi:MAG: molybdenum cofactor biosynthesis protein MoaE [Actinobacteria bacterium]|nr:molybdenum cofactor biosynthesis protein MoaE [Actinomycetota bacterium]
MTAPPRADPRVTVVLDREALDIAAAAEAVSHPQCGGIGVFLGVVRDHHAGEAVDSLDYEAWEDRAVSEMRAVGEGVVERFPGVRAVHLAHRLGHLEIGEPSVIVAASAPHRAEALDACRALIDDLKASVPIWKHEHLADGTTRWPGSPGP